MKHQNFLSYWKYYEGMTLLRLDRSYRDVEPWWKIRFRGRLWEAWYYFKCKFWHKYSTVTPKTLWPTWADADTKLLHTMFQILVDVVEKEDWFNQRVYYQGSDEGPEYTWDGRDEFQEVAVLYDWWTRRRRQRLDAEKAALSAWHDKFTSLGGMQPVPTEDPLLSRLEFPRDRPNNPEDLAEEARLSEAHRQCEADGEAEDEEMMIRLVKIRGYLWT